MDTYKKMNVGTIPDGTIWIELGDREKGPHYQFTAYANIKVATEIKHKFNLYPDLLEALEKAKGEIKYLKSRIEKKDALIKQMLEALEKHEKKFGLSHMDWCFEEFGATECQCGMKQMHLQFRAAIEAAKKELKREATSSEMV